MGIVSKEVGDSLGPAKRKNHQKMGCATNVGSLLGFDF
jgi:hypothetical protein